MAFACPTVCGDYSEDSSVDTTQQIIFSQTAMQMSRLDINKGEANVL